MSPLLLFLLGMSVVAALLGMIASLLLLLLLFRLRTKHSTYWHAIGSPSLIRWLWRNQYGDLNDSQTVGVARLIKTLVVVFVGGGAASLVGMFLLKGSS